MSKVIALTGTSGAMGSEVLLSLMQSDENFNVRCILFDEEKTIPSFVKKIIKKYHNEKNLEKFPSIIIIRKEISQGRILFYKYYSV